MFFVNKSMQKETKSRNAGRDALIPPFGITSINKFPTAFGRFSCYLVQFASLVFVHKGEDRKNVKFFRNILQFLSYIYESFFRGNIFLYKKFQRT